MLSAALTHFVRIDAGSGPHGFVPFSFLIFHRVPLRGLAVVYDYQDRRSGGCVSGCALFIVYHSLARASRRMVFDGRRPTVSVRRAAGNIHRSGRCVGTE